MEIKRFTNVGFELVEQNCDGSFNFVLEIAIETKWKLYQTT